MDEGEGFKDGGLVVEVEQGILAELGELCHEPTANCGVAGGQREASAGLDEVIGNQILLAVGKAVDERLHILVGQVLELITVELLALLVGVGGRACVGLVDNLKLGEITADSGNRLVFCGFGVVHRLGTGRGDGDGSSGKVNL